MRLYFQYLILIFIYSIRLNAQIQGQLIESSLNIKIPFTVTNYGTKHGLPQSQVLGITNKKNGILILSTANGIVEYNGQVFKPITQQNNFENKSFTKLNWHEKTQQLFIEGVFGGVYLAYPTFKKLNQYHSMFLENDNIYGIDENGNLFSSNVTIQNLKKIAETGIKKANSIILKNKNFYIGSIEGISKFSLKEKKTKKLLNETILRFKINPYNHDIYAIGINAIFQIKNDSIIIIDRFDKHHKDIICNDIEFVSKNEYLIATSHGLFEINPEYTELYTKKSALPSQYLYSLYYDKSEHCLFIGTGEKGLVKLQYKTCYSFSSSQGFGETASLSSIIKTSSRDVLVSSTDGHIIKVDMDTVYPYCDTKAVFSSLAEINGIIFAGTWGEGVKLIKDKQLIGTLNTPNNLTSGFVHATFQDSYKTIWIGNKGVSKGTNLKNIKPYLINEIKGDVIVFYELKNKNLCIGSSDGAYILDNKRKIIKHLNSKDGLICKEVRSFYEDSEGKLWIGTYNGGLYCYHNQNLKRINSIRNSKLDIDAFCLAKDNFGFIYITSNHGLWKIKESDLNDFYYGKLKYLIPFFYGEESGILNTEFNGGFQNNYLKTKMNHFYFPTLQGIVIVTPEEPVFRKLNPKIDKIIVNDTLVNSTIHTFKRNTYSIQFDISCVSFADKYNLFYQYKLETPNQKSDWSLLQNKGNFSFKLLSPNQYTFSVRAIDAFNDRQPSELKYVFEIVPYFYETKWFIILCVGIFILFTYIIYRNRIKKNKIKAEEQERIRRELAELELKAVHAKMNPHFIFNSLNSIKHYLYKNDIKKADTFIDTFSILLRDFMDYSTTDFITIERETHILNSYLSLESMRINPSFDFEINVPTELMMHNIPTMLFQPFVENSIKHGINHSEKKCQLILTFKQVDSYIVCTIDDNGIGRKKSKEINKRNKYHESKGMSIVNDKIKILKELYNFDVKLIIEDKISTDNESIGTKITLIIPIKHD